jgi:hypothetical protein
MHFACMMGGGEAGLLPHLVDHYRGLGIESFSLIWHSESAADPWYEVADALVRRAGLTFLHRHIGPYDEDLHQRLIHFAMSQHPDDWYVVADLDELHVYDRPLSELVELCEREGFDHVNGCFVDRVAADGSFPDIGTGPLWRQYPLAGSVSAGLLRALPLKTGIARGSVDLLPGQHGAPTGRGLPRDRGYIQVHHFKWTGSVVARLRRRVERFRDGAASGMHLAIEHEARRFLAHVETHGGRIDTACGRLRLEPCGNGYHDHPRWSEIADEAQGWRWALRWNRSDRSRTA